MSLNLKETYGLLINNEWVPASDGTLFEAHNQKQATARF